MTHPRSTTARRTAHATHASTKVTRKLKRHSRSHLHEPRTFGERIADSVANGMGSWRFIIIQSAIVLVWISANVWFLTHPFDPYPLILLNLLFSTQAAYAAPIIMMSQNRQAAKDRMRDDLEASEVATLLKLNKQQLEILNQQNEILALLHAASENKQETKQTKEKKEVA